MTEWNENLTPWRGSTPTNKGGQGSIENLRDAVNVVWQSRSAPPTEYETNLGDALEAIMGDGTHDLPGIVSGLNQRKVRARDGSTFTESSLKEELGRLAG